MGILAYSVAYSGLQNASQRMNVANNNIANLNTPFYRREVLNQSASLYLQQGYDMFIGTGVKSDSTSQIKDEQLFTKEMNQQQDLQFSSTFKSNLSSIESLFNDVNNQGLSSYLQSFNTAMTKMSLSPTDNALATTVINTGKDLTNYTNMVNTQINNEKTLTDSKMSDLVNQVNAKLNNIQKLNYEIRMQGQSPALMNTIDSELYDLNKIIPISVTDKYNNIIIDTQNTNLMSVNTVNSISFNNVTNTLQTAMVGISTSGMKSQLGGLFEYKAQLNSTQSQFNTDISNYFTAFNTQNQVGYNVQNTTNIPFFNQTAGQWGVSAQSNEIGYSDSINQVSNNKNLEIMRAMSTGLSTAYKSMTTGIGLTIQTQQKSASFFQTLYNNTESQRQELEGVNLEEENMHLTQAQQAYQANLKVIETANSMWNALISIRS